MNGLKIVPVLIVLMAALLFSGSVVAAAEQTQLLTLKDSVSDSYVVSGGNRHVSISFAAPDSGKIGGKPYKGFRLYRQKLLNEISFGKPNFELVQDLKNETSCRVGELQNGLLYTFYLKAYDDSGTEFWQTTVYGLPGVQRAGKPQMPQDCYGVAGDGRAALYWEKSLEADLRGYEVFRKGPGDAVFRSVARIPKIFRVKQQARANAEAGYVAGLSPPGYVDTAVENGRLYVYQVRAVASDGVFSDVAGPVALTPKPYAPPAPEEVLLIVDDSFDGSDEVARYYAEKRKIPAANIFHYRHNRAVYATDYGREIQYPLQRFLLKNGIAGTIRYLVPCYGVPTGAAGRALDSLLTDLFDRYTFGANMGAPNPYFNSRRHFDGTTGTYLVSRLDGPSIAVAKGLVDKALAAEKSVTAGSGTAYFGSRGGKSIGDVSIGQAAETGKKLGVRVVAKTGQFAEHELGDDAYWYFAWYHGYRDPVRGEWPTGAVGAHLISSSFSTIRASVSGKSWVQGLLEKGITGTFGAVIEPYEQGYTRPDIFFEQFWSGDYTFAESFAMATPTINWAMSAVGDPLYQLRNISIYRPH